MFKIKLDIVDCGVRENVPNLIAIGTWMWLWSSLTSLNITIYTCVISIHLEEVSIHKLSNGYAAPALVGVTGTSPVEGMADDAL